MHTRKMAAERRSSFSLFKNALIEGVYLCAIILFCEAQIFNYLSLFIIRTEHHKAYIHPLLFVAMLLLSICYNVWKYFFHHSVLNSKNSCTFAISFEQKSNKTAAFV